MTQKEIIKQLLTSSSNYDYLTAMLDQVREQAGINKPVNEIETMLKSGMSEKELSLELDELINGFTAELEMTAFQTGIDYALSLLGHDQVFNLLPASQTKKDIQA